MHLLEKDVDKWGVDAYGVTGGGMFMIFFVVYFQLHGGVFLSPFPIVCVFRDFVGEFSSVGDFNNGGQIWLLGC